MKMFCDYHNLIQDVIGEEGKLLINFVENLKDIVGEQSDTFESFSVEAKNRFHYIFVKFNTAIASINSPLTILLDKLQWADLASIELITALVKGSVKT